LFNIYKIAKEIFAKVENYVNNYLNLTFNPEKTSIVDFLRESFNFLGFTIHPSIPRKRNKPFETIIANGKTIIRRKKTQPVINVNIEKMFKKLAKGGFIRKRVSHIEHNKLI
jgi:anaerobic ribonucleoside-triphosphate reductase